MIAQELAERTRGTTRQVVLGDEALALAAAHAGASAAYAYPGTPATEIVDYLIRYMQKKGRPLSSWCTNEKTAYEAALGVSMVGKRALVAMKHVGLNVAADPFINSAIVAINGGLVVGIADDPSMHSSQNEQDSRYLADFARIPCLEPANQQEAYDMTRQAFDLSERFQVPVMVRLVTRLAHSRAVVETRPAREENLLRKPRDSRSWTLLPAFSRRQWHELLGCQPEMRKWSEDSPHNKLRLNPDITHLGVITTGIARNYYLENLLDLGCDPPHLHVGAYPLPVNKIRKLAESVDRILVMEEGYPYLERYLRGILPVPIEIHGKESGHLPMEGELTPDIVRHALGIPALEGIETGGVPMANRPPQLCSGCPHGNAYTALKTALQDYEQPLVASDIGCYTLGALPPYSAIESCVCMGASIGMARGASEAGLHPAVAVIGDSTFLHSGVTSLMDAAAADTDMTLLILDNSTIAMTGMQPTILQSKQLEDVVLGVGAPAEHVHVLKAHPKTIDELSALLKQEMEHRGLSVIIATRECLELGRQRRRDEKKARESTKEGAK